MYTRPGHIEITTHGTAPASFAHALFKVHFTTYAASGPRAKDKAKDLIDTILRVVEKARETARIDTDRLQSTFKVEPNRVYRDGSHQMIGYRADYTITFTAKEMSEATSIHDLLTGIDGITAESPAFIVANTAEAADAAFKDAWTKAEATMTAHCEAVRMATSDWRLSCWHVHDPRDNENPKMMSLPGGPQPKIEPGKATHQVTVSFLFERNP